MNVRVQKWEVFLDHKDRDVPVAEFLDDLLWGFGIGDKDIDFF